MSLEAKSTAKTKSPKGC